MSRCFPFPPPGYVRKTRSEDIDLFRKEKHKEKKHKKDKRDKEKKEKREKDRSNEKQKEKKEKKEKHRDKKKDKDKNRDKDKNNHVMSDEKKIMAHAEATKGEKNYDTSKESERVKNTASSEKVMGNSASSNGVVLGKNSHLAFENKNLRQLNELGNKVPIEEGKISNMFAVKYPITDNKKDVGMVRMGVSTPATPMATSERSKERKINDGRMDMHGLATGGRPSENVLVQRVARNRFEGLAREVQKNDRMPEVSEKSRGMERDGKKGEKRKYGDREHSIEKCMEKDKRTKVERSLDMDGEMLVEQSTTKDSNKVHADLLRRKDGNKKDFLVAQTARTAKLVKEGEKAVATTPEILKKRKDFGPNGVVHEGDIGPNKMPRIVSSSFPATDNGSRASPNATSVSAPVKQQPLSIAKQDEANVAPSEMARTMSSSLPFAENGRSLQPSQEYKALSKIKQDFRDSRIYGSRGDHDSGAVKKLLPHPDTKYLAQVLSVPKMEDWCDFDEQEWLLSSSRNKPKAEIRRIDDTIPQVWAEALRIESADVYALPYVIPR